MARKDFTFRTRPGSDTLYVTFYVQEIKDGHVKYGRVERSTGTNNEREALATAKVQRAQEIARRANKPEPEAKPVVTFGTMALAYLKMGKSNPNLLKLGNVINGVPADQINQEFADRVSREMFPNCTDATRNSGFYTPLLAVMNAYDVDGYRPPKIRRPKNAHPKSNFQRPPKDWWAKFVDAAPARLGALVLFMRLHGRRIGEAIAIKPDDIDRENWMVRISDTKTDQEIYYEIARPVIDLLQQYAWWDLDFIFGFEHRQTVYKAMKRVCKKAGIPYHKPKDAGRHSMATGLLAEGLTLAEVQQAGRWKSYQTVANHYSHLEHRDVDAKARAVGEKWAGKNLQKADVVKPVFAKNLRKGKGQ